MGRNTSTARPDFLQRLGLKPIPADPKLLIDQLLRQIVETFFSPFVSAHAEETSASKAGQRVRKYELLNLLIQNVGIVAAEKEQKQPQITLALRITPDPDLQRKRLMQFVSAAKEVFDTRHEKPVEFNRTIKSYMAASQLIAAAILETVLSIPLRFYNGPENVTSRVEESLYNILSNLERIRITYELEEVLDLTSATNQLHRRIAMADDYVWLPVKPLITAPLADLELPLYARENTDANNLANQIVSSDGVILVTGYRGVGKSTFINRVLQNIKNVQPVHTDNVQCQIIPINVSVAKIAGVGGALRLCIRALYRTFRDLEKIEQTIEAEKTQALFHRKSVSLLTDHERRHLEFANLRASFRVNMSQAEARSQSRSLRSELGLNPGDFFVGPVKSAVMAIVPTIGYKTSKDWNEKMDRTVSLLDYDEDRAEDDISQCH